MSSLIFDTTEEEAIIATDTLVVSHDTKLPFNFTSKAITLPHIRMVIAGTGCAGFSTRWAAIVNDSLSVKDIDFLDEFTPENLFALWTSYREEFSIPPDVYTTTIYHFGFSREKNVIHSYAYRSENDFESEPLSYGLCLKPEAQVPEDLSLMKSIKAIMESQRSIQSSKPENERLYIGGEIQVIVLNKDGFLLFSLGKFDDYSSNEAQIYANFDQDAE